MIIQSRTYVAITLLDMAGIAAARMASCRGIMKSCDEAKSDYSE